MFEESALAWFRTAESAAKVDRKADGAGEPLDTRLWAHRTAGMHGAVDVAAHSDLANFGELTTLPSTFGALAGLQQLTIED